MTVGEWLDTREPPVPAAFRPWLDELLGSANQIGPADLTAAIDKALSRALSPSGRTREGAFDLLAADAMVTYGAELAFEGAEEPVAHLMSMIEQLAHTDQHG